MLPMIETLATASGAILGWAWLVREVGQISKKQSLHGERLGRIEGMLANGVSTEVRAARETIETVRDEIQAVRDVMREHVSGEEERFLGALKRRGY